MDGVADLYMLDHGSSIMEAIGEYQALAFSHYTKTQGIANMEPIVDHGI